MSGGQIGDERLSPWSTKGCRNLTVVDNSLLQMVNTVRGEDTTGKGQFWQRVKFSHGLTRRSCQLLFRDMEEGTNKGVSPSIHPTR
jgi:hypothetical protein